MQIEIEGTLELAEVRHAFRWTRRLQEEELKGTRPSGLDNRLFGPFFVVVAVVMAIAGNVLLAIACALIGSLLLFPGLVYWPWQWHWQYVVLPGEYREAEALFRLRWRLDDLGLDLIDGRPSEVRYNWTDYRAYAEDESGFLLYWWPEPGADPETLGDREQIVHYLPRRVFTAEQAAEFSAFLRAKFAERDQADSAERM